MPAAPAPSMADAEQLLKALTIDAGDLEGLATRQGRDSFELALNALPHVVEASSSPDKARRASIKKHGSCLLKLAQSCLQQAPPGANVPSDVLVVLHRCADVCAMLLCRLSGPSLEPIGTSRLSIERIIYHAVARGVELKQEEEVLRLACVLAKRVSHALAMDAAVACAEDSDVDSDDWGAEGATLRVRGGDADRGHSNWLEEGWKYEGGPLGLCSPPKCGVDVTLARLVIGAAVNAARCLADGAGATQDVGAVAEECIPWLEALHDSDTPPLAAAAGPATAVSRKKRGCKGSKDRGKSQQQPTAGAHKHAQASATSGEGAAAASDLADRLHRVLTRGAARADIDGYYGEAVRLRSLSLRLCMSHGTPDIISLANQLWRAGVRYEKEEVDIALLESVLIMYSSVCDCLVARTTPGQEWWRGVETLDWVRHYATLCMKAQKRDEATRLLSDAAAACTATDIPHDVCAVLAATLFRVTSATMAGSHNAVEEALAMRHLNYSSSLLTAANAGMARPFVVRVWRALTKLPSPPSAENAQPSHLAAALHGLLALADASHALVSHDAETAPPPAGPSVAALRSALAEALTRAGTLLTSCMGKEAYDDQGFLQLINVPSWVDAERPTAVGSLAEACFQQAEGVVTNGVPARRLALAWSALGREWLECGESTRAVGPLAKSCLLLERLEGQTAEDVQVELRLAGLATALADIRAVDLAGRVAGRAARLAAVKGCLQPSFLRRLIHFRVAAVMVDEADGSDMKDGVPPPWLVSTLAALAGQGPASGPLHASAGDDEHIQRSLALAELPLWLSTATLALRNGQEREAKTAVHAHTACCDVVGGVWGAASRSTLSRAMHRLQRGDVADLSGDVQRLEEEVNVAQEGGTWIEVAVGEAAMGSIWGEQGDGGKAVDAMRRCVEALTEAEREGFIVLPHLRPLVLRSFEAAAQFLAPNGLRQVRLLELSLSLRRSLCGPNEEREAFISCLLAVQLCRIGRVQHAASRLAHAQAASGSNCEEASLNTAPATTTSRAKCRRRHCTTSSSSTVGRCDAAASTSVARLAMWLATTAIQDAARDTVASEEGDAEVASGLRACTMGQASASSPARALVACMARLWEADRAERRGDLRSALAALRSLASYLQVATSTDVPARSSRACSLPADAAGDDAGAALVQAEDPTTDVEADDGPVESKSRKSMAPQAPASLRSPPSEGDQLLPWGRGPPTWCLPECLVRMGEIWEALGVPEKALGYYGRARQAASRWSACGMEARAVRGQARILGEEEVEVEEGKDAVVEAAAILLRKGDRYRRTDDLQEALRVYDRAARLLDGDLKADVDGTATMGLRWRQAWTAWRLSGGDEQAQALLEAGNGSTAPAIERAEALYRFARTQSPPQAPVVQEAAGIAKRSRCPYLARRMGRAAVAWGMGGAEGLNATVGMAFGNAHRLEGAGGALKDLLPEGWTVVTLALAPDGGLLLGRVSRGVESLACVGKSEELHNALEEVKGIVQECSETLRGRSVEEVATWGKTEVKAWWKEREELDARLSSVLADVEAVLGPWRWVLVGQQDAEGVTTHVHDMVDRLGPWLPRREGLAAVLLEGVMGRVEAGSTDGYLLVQEVAELLSSWREGGTVEAADILQTLASASSSAATDMAGREAETPADSTDAAVDIEALTVGLKKLTVVELRKKLSARSLPTTGLKVALVQRLTQAMAAMDVGEDACGERPVASGSKACGKRGRMRPRAGDEEAETETARHDAPARKTTVEVDSAGSIGGNRKERQQTAVKATTSGGGRVACTHLAANGEGRTGAMGPVILVLDEKLQALPWESLAVLREQPVSRCPSTEYVEWAIKRATGTGTPISATGLTVPCSPGFFLLDPEDNLARTRESLEPFFDRCREAWGWEGAVGAPPKEDELKSHLSRSSVFMYCGHGSGEAFLPREEVAGMLLAPDGGGAPMAILMGCSSGRLKAQSPEFEPTGMALSYLAGGSPAVVANLWDVTDRDIDRFSLAMVQELLHSSKQRGVELLRAVSRARTACKLSYLVGAAPVIYGLPVELIQ